MKRTPLRKVSKKQAKRNRELAKIPPPEDGKCQQCHELPDFRGLAKHHIILRSRGGSDSRDNLVFLCGRCHNLAHHIFEVREIVCEQCGQYESNCKCEGI
jgi:5-methylcytosine-specific restriction endonuclease McrA